MQHIFVGNMFYENIVSWKKGFFVSCVWPGEMENVLGEYHETTGEHRRKLENIFPKMIYYKLINGRFELTQKHFFP